MSSIELISWWISSRSNGVMKVLFNSAMVSWVTVSARCSADSDCGYQPFDGPSLAGQGIDQTGQFFAESTACRRGH